MTSRTKQIHLRAKTCWYPERWKSSRVVLFGLMLFHFFSLNNTSILWLSFIGTFAKYWSRYGSVLWNWAVWSSNETNEWWMLLMIPFVNKRGDGNCTPEINFALSHFYCYLYLFRFADHPWIEVQIENIIFWSFSYSRLRQELSSKLRGTECLNAEFGWVS